MPWLLVEAMWNMLRDFSFRVKKGGDEYCEGAYDMDVWRTG